MPYLPVKGSFDRYRSIIPKGIKIIKHHYDGSLFSEYYILSLCGKELSVHFGADGYDPDAAEQRILEFFDIVLV
jgi:hypothetical protein